jgi:hypothetical protein
MERFETESLALMPGQRVRAKVLSHHPWGVIVEIAGYENAGLSVSVDMIQQFSHAASTYEELLALFPPVGARIDAVIQQIHRWHPPVSVRLSIRPADLESLAWRCDFCGEGVTLTPGGDALVPPALPGRADPPGERRRAGPRLEDRAHGMTAASRTGGG